MSIPLRTLQGRRGESNYGEVEIWDQEAKVSRLSPGREYYCLYPNPIREERAIRERLSRIVLANVSFAFNVSQPCKGQKSWLSICGWLIDLTMNRSIIRYSSYINVFNMPFHVKCNHPSPLSQPVPKTPKPQPPSQPAPPTPSDLHPPPPRPSAHS